MSASAAYDAIGREYARQRRPDPRVAARVTAALGAARTVLNVGAGAGSYEPADRAVMAVEPSAVMLAQRPAGAAPAVRAGISPFARADLAPAIEAGLGRLRADLASGAWEARHGDPLRAADALDVGYRLVVAEAGARAC